VQFLVLIFIRQDLSAAPVELLVVQGPGPKYGTLNEKVPQQHSRMHPNLWVR